MFSPFGGKETGGIVMKRVGVCVLLAVLVSACGCSSLSRDDSPKPKSGPVGDISSEVTPGLLPATGQTIQTQYRQIAGSSNVQPVSGSVRTGTTGTGSFLMPSPKPATGGSDCNH